MKNFIFILLFSFTSLVGYSQLTEDFEDAPDNADASGVWTLASGNWSVRDNRTNANPNWRKNVAPFPANSGVKAAYVDRENTGPGILAEEWLITPQRIITANNQLRFFTRQTLIGDDSSAKYQVRVSSGADQNDLASYTVLIEYTETELSTITADQLDYEEKVIDLSFTGPRYFAFVRVTTQAGLATSGDRWLIDDVKIVEKCVEPTVLSIETATISATTTKLLWTSPGNTEFQVQYGPTGFVLDVAAPFVVISPVFTSTTTPRNYLATELQPNTGYQFYVRSVCTDSEGGVNNSIWVGPFNWNTKPLGSICSAPIVVTPPPYSDSSNTTIYGNNIINGTPGNTGCGAGAGFLGGNDVVYSFTPVVTGNIVISMDPQGSTNTGIFVYANCASIGNTCIGGVGNNNASIRTIPSLAVTAGQPIFIVISSTTATPTFAYTLSIQEATCPQPTSLSASSFGPTSGTASWVNGTGSTATSWEIAVQPTGAAIPTTAGIQTNSNTNYPINTTVTGAPLAPSTCYQYWVRADCGNGQFSPWSGPFLFCTSGCEILNQCDYTFTLTDTASDGWEGGRMQVIQNGLVVATLGATITGATATVIVPLCTAQPFSLFWSIAGASPGEIRINIKNGFSQTIYAMTTNSQALIGTTLYSGMADCVNPLCLQPTANAAVPAALINFNGATITWNTAGTSATTTTGFGIYVVLQGEPAPDATTVPTYTTTAIGPGPVSYTIEGLLLPDTNYTVYVQSLCSVNGPSAWTPGTNFKTKEQCPKPTALTATLINPFGATLGWTNPTGALWDVLIQFASLPDPLPNDPAWITDLTTNSYIPTNLIPETAYEFYVRTDCGLTIISNPAGPKAFTTGIACPKPTALGTTALTPFGGTFTWTSPGTAFEVIVLPAGSPAPLAGDTGIAATPSPYLYNGTPLTPETNYVYYVRNICGGINGVSTWSGPRAFLTTPTCFKPTNLLAPAAGIEAFQVQLTWNSVATTTAWQILAQAPGDPAPTAASTGWVTVNPGDAGAGPLFTYNYTGLTPETAYVFYIRGNCGDTDGTSTWTGPRAATTKPSCYKPTALTATDITPFTASLGWTNNPLSPVTEWQILILPQGTTAPTTAQMGTVITQNAYPATGLIQNTCYDYYVRSSCGGVNGVSTWSGPKNFCTPPTCPQPTNLGAANNTDPNADLSWTGPANSGQWQVFWQAPSGTVPGPNTTTGSLVTAPTINTGNLEPGFYEFYVRAICSDTDKSTWSGPFNFFIATSQPVCASVEINVTTTSPGVIDLCPGENCVDLVADFTDSKDTTTYTVLPVGFAPPFPFTGGTQLPVTTDDVWSAPFTLPFNFCFYGVNYPKVNVGSNGVITFNNQAAGDNCAWNTDPGVTIPNPAFPIRNAIYGVYQDINPNVATGASPADVSINYQVLGVAPCRAFVVNYYKVGQYDCDQAVGLQTSQIVLYETSNIIEVYVQDRTVCTGWNEGSGVIGIQNEAGTFAHFPPGRNLGPWEAHNEAWRFTPDGASNVVFSWLKGGEFYSNEGTINVCVSETTNMTAQAVYTGCGGQITTKTEDVLLRIAPLELEPIQDVQACQSYTLPVLPLGDYYSQPGGVGLIDRTIPLTASQIVYVYASTLTTPACTAEIQFTVNIVPVLIAPTPPPATGCESYILPPVENPFNYYTGPLGTGTMYTGLGGDSISTPQTLYIYGESGLCTAQSTLDISIDTVELFVQNSVSDCNNFTLLGLPANNTYYTATGGPNGTGTIIAAGTVIDQTQTIYIYAQSGTCTDEGNFTVSIFGIDPPTVTLTQPDCQTTTGSIEVNTPLNPTGAVTSDLFISEVTDEDTSGSSLTYIELFNATGSAKDLSNYKLKVYNNGNTFTSCEVTLTGIIANNATNIIKISNSPNQGGVVPNQTYTICSGINTDDNIRLTSISDVEIDLWGATDGTAFTPNGETGYDYRRNATATIPSTTWNPADWTADENPVYSDVGFYPILSSNVYEYNIDGGPWQFTTTFGNVAIGQHTITVREIATGCTNSVVVDIQPSFVNAPVTTITYTPTSVCNNSTNDLTPDTSTPDFVIGGSYTAIPNTLVIDASTGVIDVDGSPAGNYTITYSVGADLVNCISAGHSDFPITINQILTPDFPEFPEYCPGAAVPTLNATSPNGVTGTWLPAVIDNQNSGSYVFTPTPDSGQCAVSRTYNVVITTPTINPTFDAIPDFCSGTTPIPGLSTMSNNSISGTWSPATIDNTQTANYVFTPNAGQCALPLTITVTVNDVLTPDFDPNITICSGTTVPTLETTSPNEIVGTWTPAIVDPNGGMYTFTPTPITGQCFNPQTIEVAVAANPVFEITAGCINGNYTLTVVSDSNFETATYVWKDSEGTVIGGNTSSIVVSQTGDYTCEVTYQGCSAPMSKNVTTISCTIQKGISPKGTGAGDGLNDYFDLEGQNVTKLEIFNRYGSKVYTKSNYSKEWYGQTDNGDELPDGTYFYVIERNGEKSRTGWIYINHEL